MCSIGAGDCAWAWVVCVAQERGETGMCYVTGPGSADAEIAKVVSILSFERS